ncbi:MAG: hypothetical protein JKY96_08815 [Phycisphaerales bacterium]|nr:hypothetical protein [Phycisphaerales bacterium]
MTTHPSPPSPPSPSPINAAKQPSLDRFTIVYRAARQSIPATLAPSGTDPVIELHIGLDARRDCVTLCLVDPSTQACRIVNAPETSVSVVLSKGGWLHLDAPGVLSCSIAGIATDSPELVYAKAEILGQLGLIGGRFEAPTLKSDG